MQKTVLLCATLLSFGAVACAQNASPKEAVVVAENSAKGMFKTNQNNGYIVTAKDEASVRRVYGTLGISLLRAIGNSQFEMRLQHDVGIREVSNLAQHSNGEITAVQPNFVYRAN